MDTIAGVFVEEYLHETYHPDCEYVDGEVQERHWGERDHSDWQLAVAAFLRNRRKEWHIRVNAELRVRISPTRYRIPDVMVVGRDAPDEQIATHAPMVCIEILSPEDRFGRMEQKVADYFSLGVREVWIIDPAVVQGYRCAGANHRDWIKTNQFAVEGTPIVLHLDEIARDLD